MLTVRVPLEWDILVSAYIGAAIFEKHGMKHLQGEGMEALQITKTGEITASML